MVSHMNILSDLTKNISRMMRGISVREFGGPEVLKISTNIPIPEPKDDQVKKEKC
jgi:hypothetical protein